MESNVTTLVEKKAWVSEETVNPTVACFILLENSNQFKIRDKSYNIKILGETMLSWVVRACPSIPTTIEILPNANPLEVIRPYLKDSEYTLVLYSDTPLITRASVNEILEYVKNKGLNVCKLTRGIVYKTEYIKRVSEVFAPQTYYFDEEDFMTAFNFKQLNLISGILKNRIIEYHMNNGVYFESPDNVTLDANVSIGSGTIIKGASAITGKTHIGENCVIDSSNIQSAKIYDNVMILNSIVASSVIEQDVKVFENNIVVDKTLVNKNTIISYNNVIKSSSIGENVCVGENNSIINARIHDLSEIGKNNVIVGEE